MAHHTFDFGHHLWRMVWGTHPTGARYLALAIHFNLKHAYRIEQRWHLAVVNALGVFGIQMAGRVFAVIFWGGRI